MEEIQNPSAAPEEKTSGAKEAENSSRPLLSVLVPVHNEEQNIPVLIGEIRAALDHLVEYEIIYVDDGSTDGTVSILQQAAHTCRQLRIVRHANNCGQSTALCTGVKAARASWVVTLDGDGQNDPADIPALWAQCTGSDNAVKLLICGYRRKRQDTRLKKISSRVANRFRQFILKDATPDTGCGIKLFPRALFLQLPYFDHMHRFLPALFLRQGGEVTSVVVNHRPRLRGQSHYGMFNRLWIGLVDTFGVAWLLRRMKHPRIFEETKNEN